MLTDQEALVLERDFLIRVLELSHHDDPTALLEEALQIVVLVSGARHGYIELEGPVRNAEVAWFSATTDALDPKLVRGMLSSTIMRATLAEGRTVQTRAAFEDARFAEAPSVRGQRIDAVVCVPIGTRPLEGVVYLQGSPDGKPFSPHVIKLCELFARHLGAVAPTLVRRVAQNTTDPTQRWRDKLVGSEVLIGSSHALAEVLKAASGAAPRDIGVLITGASGSGKSALAQLIAANGARSKGPFIPVNCANLQTGLVESELFGAMQGSHSTANRRISGKVEAADKGTLFLDEVAELALPVQSKLLQFLQDKTFFPLGGTRALVADVRVIAATNAHLLERVKLGTFREDLYYRLCVIEIAMPALDDRRIDISLLAEAFLREAISRLALPPLTLSKAALRALEVADWPGNIRQLRNVVDASTVRALADETPTIEVGHLFPGAREPDPRSTFQAIMRSYQRQVISEALARHDWNVSDAATSLGLGRSSLYQLIKTLSLEKSP